ncbi:MULTISPECIES: isoprenylcysteine carboxyl methyltransferase family protein [Fictibacillus]|uniref:Isoprenylcysteine carboxyl methyltransferase n=1 Tax=Fictibacillus enclensis TaxID=1017270 RepID=A0A0V8JFC1_9BACL|nr:MULTISPECIES: isoprenylcysteine carboxyl methyltransferase family protein [Fictibacillus]KSU85628.1 isoprenylcysteine carboxyl methyltransferase [Fictibacillus enclensis]RXY98679.1 isoprenylcysteine carboxyl methyltransferase [Fictibacillus sp. S7]SCB99961.1 15-methylpalmitoyl-4-hydroxy-2-pyrone 4-O-methyltransferase [Fictibacillus enclensis]
MLFWIFFAVLVIQRLAELLIARKNEKYLLSKGAFEAGREHYKWMVGIHTCFFISFLVEVLLFNKQPAFWWWIPFSLFLLAQCARVWCISSLGHFWNTKIIILPGAHVVAKGPYKYIRHPNYVIVTLEIITIPLVFQAYFTMVLFLILNAVILSVRIPEEEKALQKATNYNAHFEGKHRFLPGDDR